MIDIFACLNRDQRPPRNWAHRVWPRAVAPHYPQTRRSLTYHEAGHAIFHYLQNLRMTGVYVDADSKSGKVSMDVPAIQATAAKLANVVIPRPLEEKITLDLATMYVAGVIAQCTLYGIRVDGVLSRDCHDWRNARKLLIDIFGNDHALFYCQELARFVLRKYWPFVTQLAIELDSKGAISAERVKEICAGAPPDPMCIS
ncbi:MAG: hypothetical protein Q7J84_13930 [Sulfuricaulis sp.]|nr:hypothetical protein [Sulfuricaulis sp.]